MRSNKLLSYAVLMAVGFLQLSGLSALNLQLSKDRQQLVQEVNKAIQAGDFEKAGEGIEQFRKANQKYQVRELSKKLVTARVAATKEAKSAKSTAVSEPESEPESEPKSEVVLAKEKEPAVTVPPAAPPIQTAAELKKEKEAKEKAAEEARAKKHLEEQRLREEEAERRKKGLEEMRVRAQQERDKAKGDLQVRLNNVANEFKEDELLLPVATVLRDLVKNKKFDLEVANVLLDIFNQVDKDDKGSWSLVNYGFRSPTQIHEGKLFVTQDNSGLGFTVDYDKAIDITDNFKKLVALKDSITDDTADALLYRLNQIKGTNNTAAALSSIKRFVGTPEKVDGNITKSGKLLENIKAFAKAIAPAKTGDMSDVFEEIRKIRIIPATAGEE